MTNIKCPHCGSEDVDLIITIEVHGKLQKDGSFKLDGFYMAPKWNPLDTPIEEVVMSGDCEHIIGSCNKCYEDCEFDWEDGYYD